MTTNMKKTIELFVLCGSGLLILLGSVFNIWEPVALGTANILLFFGVPHIIDQVLDAARRRK